MEVGLALGSNMGDRLARLREARSRLLELPGVMLLAQSPVYDTDPVGVPEEFSALPFLNAVLILECRMQPPELHGHAMRIELEMGRARAAEKNAPRRIDIDFIYAGRLRIDTPELVVPHPRWAGRRFVLAPLASVRPELIIPGQSRTVSEVLRSLRDPARAREFARDW